MKSLAVDVVGARFGRLVVEGRAPNPGTKRASWSCRCDCGDRIVAVGLMLRQGRVKSCGCLKAPEDLVGRVFGKWTVVSHFDVATNRNHRWTCRCCCGVSRVVTGKLLRAGQSKSCGGCSVQWIGFRSGRLVVLEVVGSNQHGQTLVRCRCDCGVEKVVSGLGIRRRTHPYQSCGCWNTEALKQRPPMNRLHGHALTADGKRSVTYQTWLGMKARCLNPKTRRYDLYGGRGITVCERWRESFENFFADMGERPSGMSIDRINPNGNYEPSNCRWATRKQQRDNQRLSAPRVLDVLASYEAEAPDLIARLRRDLLG